jgi:hypothetical protein
MLVSTKKLNANSRRDRSKQDTAKHYNWSDFVQLLIIAVAVVYTGWLRFTLPALPIIDDDSGGYLTPAIDFYNGRGLALLYSRAFPYPLFLGLILKLLGSFSTMVVLQHLAGLAAAVVIWMTFRRLAAAAGNSGQLKSILGISGAIAGCLFSLDLWTVYYEQSIRPESMNSLVVAFVFFAHAAALEAYTSRDHRRFSRWFVAVVALNAFSYYFRPNVGFAVLLGPAVVTMALLFGRFSLARKIITTTSAAVAVLCLCILPQRYFQSFRDDGAPKIFLPLALLACHGQLIAPVVDEDIKKGDFSHGTPEQLGWLRKVLVETFDKHISGEDPGLALLGINPDTIMYHSEDTGRLIRSFKTPDAFASFGYYYFGQMVLRNPLGYLTKVRGQLSVVYGETRGDPFPGSASFDNAAFYKMSRDIAPSLFYFRSDRSNELVGRYTAALDREIAQARPPADEPLNQTKIARTIQPYLSIAHWWASLLYLPLFAAYLLLSRFLSHPTSLGTKACVLTGSAGAFVLLYNFLHCFSVAAIGALEVGRYILAQASSFIVFLALTSAFVVAVLCQLGAALIGNSRHLSNQAETDDRPLTTKASAGA